MCSLTAYPEIGNPKAGTLAILDTILTAKSDPSLFMLIRTDWTVTTCLTYIGTAPHGHGERGLDLTLPVSQDAGTQTLATAEGTEAANPLLLTSLGRRLLEREQGRNRTMQNAEFRGPR
jgi:hypothetical protein